MAVHFCALSGRELLRHSFGKKGFIGETLPLNTSFLLFGQRYTLDSHVFSNVVYDRVATTRMLPDPLDVAYAAFGNDQAAELLQPELELYKYAGDLEGTRILADAHDESFWQGNLYNQWLKAIRGMSPTESTERWDSVGRPQITATDAWGRRVLNSQLASWAELRHDTLLYAKQSYTAGGACEFPDAYVDPYPETYAAIVDFARLGEKVLVDSGLGPNDPAVAYFARLAETASILLGLAEKQRIGEPYSTADMEFINSAVSVAPGCDGPAGINGWYGALFYSPADGVEYEPTIADVHTQPYTATGTPVGNVLHVATGMPNLMVTTVDTCSGPRAYVGLVSSYYERVETDFNRLDDQAWEETLEGEAVERPEWYQPVMR